MSKQPHNRAHHGSHTAAFEHLADAMVMEHAVRHSKLLWCLSDLAEAPYDPDDAELVPWHESLEHSRRAMQEAYRRESVKVLHLALEYQVAVGRVAATIQGLDPDALT